MYAIFSLDLCLGVRTLPKVSLGFESWIAAAAAAAALCTVRHLCRNLSHHISAKLCLFACHGDKKQLMFRVVFGIP